uniref:Group-specific protein n=1 Tax=Parastrongyloides trichosuri TaxID=131310 RepID=A0A0N4ZPI1_PARTI
MITSEATKSVDDFNVVIVIVVCIVFCILVRHFNDFYTGETITLVEEGTWIGRFKHKEKDDNNGRLKMIEKDFDEMYKVMKLANKKNFTDQSDDEET